MTGFDWHTPPRRPLSSDDVWEFLRHGCNVEEVACAGGVSRAVAVAMMAESARLHAHGEAKPVLHLERAA